MAVNPNPPQSAPPGPASPGGASPLATTPAGTVQPNPAASTDYGQELAALRGQRDQINNQITQIQQQLRGLESDEPTAALLQQSLASLQQSKIAISRQIVDTATAQQKAAQSDPTDPWAATKAQLDVQVASAQLTAAQLDQAATKAKLDADAAARAGYPPEVQAQLKQQADMLANQSAQMGMYVQQSEMQASATRNQLTAAQTTAQNIQNQYLPAQLAAGVNKDQAAAAASLSEVATNNEQLRRLQEGEFLAKAEDLDRAVQAGKITQDQALALLDDYMQGTTPFERQKNTEANLLAAGRDALQAGALFAPGQAEALHTQYAALGARFGMPAVDVPASGEGVRQFVNSLGVDTGNPYRDATRAGLAAAGSLSLGSDWRGLDLGAVQRALRSSIANGGASAPQMPGSTPPPGTNPTLLAVPPAGPAAPAATVPAAPAVPAMPTPVAAGSLTAPPKSNSSSAPKKKPQKATGFRPD